MKYWLIAALITLMPVHSSLAGELKPYTGPALPDFTLNDMQGKAHRLSDYRGKVVLLNFWATWCPPCIKEMPSMQRLQAQLAGQDFTILAVNMGETEADMVFLDIGFRPIAEEPAEDPLTMLFRDPGAFVGHRDFGRVGLRSHRDRDDSVGGRKTDGVVDQVFEDLGEPVRRRRDDNIGIGGGDDETWSGRS